MVNIKEMNDLMIYNPSNSTELILIKKIENVSYKPWYKLNWITNKWVASKDLK